MTANGERFLKSGAFLIKEAAQIAKRIREGKNISEEDRRIVVAAALLIKSAQSTLEVEPQIMFFQLFIPREDFPEDPIPSEPAPKTGKEI